MKHKIKTALQYEQTELSFERVTDKISLTIPDQTMSLRELVANSRTNQPTDGMYIGDDPELNKAADIHRMELTDRNEYAEKLNQKVRDLSDQVGDQIKSNRKKKLKDELQREMDTKPAGDPKPAETAPQEPNKVP